VAPAPVLRRYALYRHMVAIPQPDTAGDPLPNEGQFLIGQVAERDVGRTGTSVHRSEGNGPGVAALFDPWKSWHILSSLSAAAVDSRHNIPQPCRRSGSGDG